MKIGISTGALLKMGNFLVLHTKFWQLRHLIEKLYLKTHYKSTFLLGGTGLKKEIKFELVEQTADYLG